MEDERNCTHGPPRSSGRPGCPTDFLLTTPFLHHTIQSGLFLGGKELTVWRARRRQLNVHKK